MLSEQELFVRSGDLSPHVVAAACQDGLQLATYRLVATKVSLGDYMLRGVIPLGLLWIWCSA